MDLNGVMDHGAWRIAIIEEQQHELKSRARARGGDQGRAGPSPRQIEEAEVRTESASRWWSRDDAAAVDGQLQLEFK